jgi:hypothetical protein
VTTILVADKLGASKAMADLGAQNQRSLPAAKLRIIKMLPSYAYESFFNAFPKEKDFVAGDFDAQDAVVALALLKEAGFKVEQFSNAFIPASG